MSELGVLSLSVNGQLSVDVKSTGPSCSKLMTLLVNNSLKISNMNIKNTLLFFVDKM